MNNWNNHSEYLNKEPSIEIKFNLLDSSFHSE